MPYPQAFFSRKYLQGWSIGGGTKAGLKPNTAGNEAEVGRTPVRTQTSIAFTAVRICGPVKYGSMIVCTVRRGWRILFVDMGGWDGGYHAKAKAARKDLRSQIADLREEKNGSAIYGSAICDLRSEIDGTCDLRSMGSAIYLVMSTRA